MKYLIANFKAHKTIFEAVQWIHEFNQYIKMSPEVVAKLGQGQIKVVICPPYPTIPIFHQNITNLRSVEGIENICIGAQNISQFKEGSYTGEVTAHMLDSLIEYAVVGHNERRVHFKEDETTIKTKIDILKENNISPILCIRNENDLIYKEASLIAYEPVESIGTNHSSSISTILDMKSKFDLKPHQLFLYGGSTTPENCQNFLSHDEIDGLLIGTASLEAKEFFQIIQSV